MGDFTFLFEPPAAAELDRAYKVHSDAGAVARAIDVIRAALSADPAVKGIPLSEGLRSYTYPPLRFVYSVDDAGRVVLVERVQLVGRPV